MQDRDALLRAVCAEPDEDTPRLAYADWLDENGDHDRAEFIRVQIKLGSLRDGKRKDALRAREKELLDVHRDEWAEFLKPYFADFYEGIYANHYGPPVVFRRGFVESVSMDVQTFLDRGDEVFRLAPVREVRFQDSCPLDDLAKCPHLLRLSALNLSGAVLASEASGSPALFRSKYLANLTALKACGFDDNGHLDAVGLRAIAAGRHLAKLRHLDLSDNWMFGTYQDLRQAAACRKGLVRLGEKLPALRELVLQNIGLLDGDLTELVQQEWVGQLKVLDLGRNNLGPAGFHTLCASKRLAPVDRLVLTGNEYHDLDSNTLVPPGAAEQRVLRKHFGKRVVV